MRKSKDKPSISEWQKIVYPILFHPEFQRRKTFRHHGDTTVYEHSVKVSMRAYSIAKNLNLDYESAAIAGLLHDFYTTPWQDVVIKQPFFKQHAFTHGRIAMLNARVYFKKYLNPAIENSILRHMFPLTPIPPKYKIGWVITTADKLESMDMLTSKEALCKTFGLLKRG